MEIESDTSVTPLNSLIININEDDEEEDNDNDDNRHLLYTSQVSYFPTFTMISENELMRNRAMAIMTVLRNMLEETEMGDLSILLVNEYSIPMDVLHGRMMIMIMIILDIELMDRRYCPN